MSKPTTRATPQRLMELAWGFAAPLVVEAAVRHRVFDLLATRPMTVEDLVAASAASARGLDALAGALLGFGLLTRDEAGRYALTDEADAFLVSGKPGYLGGLFRHASRQLVPGWLHLADVVASGTPRRGGEADQDSAAFFAEFVEDIFPLSYPAARALAAELHIAEATAPVSVLDLGAGSGVWGIALAESSPLVTIRAIDLPAVLPVTRRIAERFGVGDRLTSVAGDLHEAEFGTGHQVATIGEILHSEGPDRSRDLLRRTFAALAPGGSVAIAEHLLDDDRRGPTGALVFAVNMLINTEAGSTFSFREIACWLKEAGFANPRLLKTPSPSPLILATRP